MYTSWFIQCTMLLLVVDVKIHSQKRFRTEFDVPEEDDYIYSIPQGRKGPNECICIPIRRCTSLRNRTDWRTAGDTCFGYGDFRGVCCPDTSENNNEECGDSRAQSYPDSLIVKGGNASEGTWPWMVYIEIKNYSGFFPHCVGFLIDRRHVITTAYCYDKRDSERTTARIGNLNPKKADEYSITRFLLHPDYNKGQFYHNIAIWTLDREVNSPDFNPVCLPDEEVGRMNLAGRALTVVGWPHIFQGTIKLKYWTGLRVIPSGECHEIFRLVQGSYFDYLFPRAITKEVICAGYADGDQREECPILGSPLMVQNGNRWFVVGIISLVYNCGRLPNVFTNVTPYLDWIRENTKD